ncbi:ribosome recycling factor [Sinomonas atrocyanea]|uniref:Ribosome-recycling factor n=1 Tax=Sinomonas atrocyanea TaxID=37927 RepID=A0A126ZZI2_9MICC|nr:ribosome recycling factor [Sinomonas atrocyanea]AMM32286.1 Ribosome-recycling factor [Sinomonas atrocyanea]MDP9883471.1 ribosome recycling factor [Sinomonas atrocyanea]MDQ0259750.1 ribosome recycling factor [Sinomonas atrocyanea]MDR6621715.1 ribosome recycling factor [Sinomonas atrocyanea]GEB66334.1 ribosome-recycling factor [Sinomonas atrocyanea]
MIEETLLEATEKMEKAVEVAKEDFASIRTGRANPALYAKVMVDYYGTPTPLQQLASFQVSDARTILITPYDKSALRDVEKALSDSEVGANPSNDGNVIRVVLPELTQERRKEYVKIVKGKGEDAKVSIRSIRRKAKESLDKLVKDGEVGEDDGVRGEKELDSLTKKHVDAVEDLVKRKEAELLEV